MVILNADDFGRDDPTTDSIIECFRMGRITSTSAMVHMRGTERGARIAGREGLPVGLHLNFTEPFDDPRTPDDVLGRQLALVRRFRRRRLKGTRLLLFPKRWIDHPALRGVVDQAIQDQLESFRSVFGRDPTHLDGHHHVHLRPTVLLSEALPRGTPIRNTRRFGVRQHEIGRRFSSTEAFVSIRQLSPWGTESLSEWVDREQPRTLEVEIHPHLGERELLLSESWRRELECRHLGSFGDLQTLGGSS
jgi:predicted glycoside hydrolase/deacetylase ChbG (UPF0249 family)